jgi:integrase
MANQVLSGIRKFFNWSKERGWIIAAPTDAIKNPAKLSARDRILDTDEIKRIWNACDDLGWPFGSAFRLMLLTGQRRNEVAQMQWQHLNSETSIWTLPQQETKSNRQHEVPLSPLAKEIIDALPRNCEYVFSTTRKTPISGFSRSKKRLDVLSDTEGWRLHDLRRTAASNMAEIGIAPHVIEKVLNHSTGQISGVAAVYNRHTYLREKTDALNAWARALEAIVEPSESNVITIGEKHD